MKDEYINKHAAIIEMMDNDVDHAQAPNGKEVVQILSDIPAADVVPVIHGKWIRSGAEGHIICDKCGYEAKYTIVERQDATGKWTSRFAQDIKTNFCPNCGAKMDGERKE